MFSALDDTVKYQAILQITAVLSNLHAQEKSRYLFFPPTLPSGQVFSFYSSSYLLFYFGG